MSARIERTAAPRWTAPATAGVTAALGVGALLLRSRFAALPPTGRVAALAALYGTILAASLVVPARPGVRRLPPAGVLAAGLGAVTIAALAAGRPVGVAFTPWALPSALLAAVAEEALLRRAAYAALEPLGAAVAVGLTALVFAAIHLPLYGVAAFPVDLGAGLLLGWQRWASGTWTVPAATHAAANLLAVILR